jgi:hypothetical protein
MRRTPRKGVNEIVERTLQVYKNLPSTAIDLPDQAWRRSRGLSIRPKSSPPGIDHPQEYFERSLPRDSSQHSFGDPVKSNISDFRPESSRHSSMSRSSSSTLGRSASTRASSVSSHGWPVGMKVLTERSHIDAEDVARRLNSKIGLNGRKCSGPRNSTDRTAESSCSIVIESPLSTASKVTPKYKQSTSKKAFVHSRKSLVGSRIFSSSNSIGPGSGSGSDVSVGYHDDHSSLQRKYRVPDDGRS